MKEGLAVKIIVCAGNITDRISDVYSKRKDTIEVVGKYNNYDDCIKAVIDEAIDFDTLLFVDKAFRDLDVNISEKVNELADTFELFLKEQELKILFTDNELYSSFEGFLNSKDRITASFSRELKSSVITDLLLKNYKAIDEEQPPMPDRVQNQYEEYIESEDAESEQDTDTGNYTESESQNNNLLTENNDEKQPEFRVENTPITKLAGIFAKVPPVPKGNYSFKKGIVAVTGDRGQGITTTAVNLASTIEKSGLSVVIVDLDLAKRDINNYFPDFGKQAEPNEFLHKSLVGCLVDSINIERYVCKLSNNLSVVGLPYTFNFGNRDKDRIFTQDNLINMLTVLRSYFDIVVIDMPFQFYIENSFLGNYIDANIFCMENNFSAIVSGMNALLGDASETQIDFRRIIFKTKFLLTKYNYISKSGREGFNITAARKIISGNFDVTVNYALNFVGIVPMSYEFIEQMNKHRPIVEISNEYKLYYDAIFSNI